jgi:hypothetical protein
MMPLEQPTVHEVLSHAVGYVHDVLTDVEEVVKFSKLHLEVGN